MSEFILIHSPLVGPSTLRPTAEALERLGARCQVPSPAKIDGEIPAWREWPGLLLDEIGTVKDAIVVGHSAGGLLAANVAASTNARALVCLDANMPPEQGRTAPVDSRFRDFVRALTVAEGRLPKWNNWWGGDVLANAALIAELKAVIVDELPRLRPEWFDDEFQMPNWSRSQRYFVRTSGVFDEEANRAEGLGWNATRIEGTHLHPTLAPQETAMALFTIGAAALT